jgi:hypothetical protein
MLVFFLYVQLQPNRIQYPVTALIRPLHLSQSLSKIP